MNSKVQYGSVAMVQVDLVDIIPGRKAHKTNYNNKKGPAVSKGYSKLHVHVKYSTVKYSTVVLQWFKWTWMISSLGGKLTRLIIRTSRVH